MPGNEWLINNNNLLPTVPKDTSPRSVCLRSQVLHPVRASFPVPKL